MTPGARRSKGQRLPRHVAESLSAALNLTIEAAAPTKPGKRPNAAVYVAEGSNADLRIRRSGQPGADLALLSERARSLLAIEERNVYVECKNCEGWMVGADMWKTGKVSKLVYKAWSQTLRAANACFADVRPMIILGKNNHPPLVILRTEDAILFASGRIASLLPFLYTKDFVIFELSRYITVLKLRI
jgi:hypothetical protein